MVRRFSIAVLAYAAMVAFLDQTMFIVPEATSDSLLGQPVPDFELPTLRDPSVTLGLADISGQPSLLNVWASWCPACRQEHAYLVELASSKSIPIFGLNYADDRSDALALLSELGDPYVASGFDEAGEVAHLLKVHGTPQTFLIDSHGIVLHRHVSALTPEVWESEFLPRLKGTHRH